jgi:hypothetical protein
MLDLPKSGYRNPESILLILAALAVPVDQFSGSASWVVDTPPAVVDDKSRFRSAGSRFFWRGRGNKHGLEPRNYVSTIPPFNRFDY